MERLSCQICRSSVAVVMLKNGCHNGQQAVGRRGIGTGLCWEEDDWKGARVGPVK